MGEQSGAIPTTSSPSAASTINADLACRKCGYNVRGLPTDGRCPECETKLNHSLRGNELLFCDPAWVLRLAAGMNWLCLATAIGALFLVGSTITGALFGMPARPEFRLGLSVLVALFALIGIGMVTTPDPAGDEPASTSRARWALRIWVIGSMALQIAFDLPSTLPTLWRGIIFLGQFSLGLAGVFIFFNFVRHLARRMTDSQQLEIETLAVMWGVVISYLLLASIIVAAMLPGRAPEIVHWIFGLSCTVAVGCVIFTIWSIVLLLQYRAALRHAAHLAQHTWRSNNGEQRQ